MHKNAQKVERKSQTFYSILKIYNFRNIVHFLKRILQVVDNAVFWQNVLLYFENRGGGEHSATPGTFCVSRSSNEK